MRRRNLALVVIGAFIVSAAAWQPLTHAALAEVVLPDPTCRAGGSTIATGPDGNLWFGETEDGEIGRLTLPAGPIDEEGILFPPPRGVDLVSGSDGNLWTVVGVWGNVIHPDLTVETFGVPYTDPSIANGGTVAAPDGNVYMLRSDGNSAEFLQMTPARTFAELTLPVGGPVSGVGDLIVGPEGSAWFFVKLSSDPNVRRLFRAPFDASSATQIAVEAPNVTVLGPLVVGSDVWYVRLGGSPALVHVDAGGIVAVVPITQPGGGSLPIAPVVGSDGRIWFAGSRDSAPTFVAVATDGSEDTFPAPIGESEDVQAMTSGPDGRIWFTTQTHVRSIATDGTPGASFEVPASQGPPVTCSVTPDAGSTGGGDVVTIKGRGFSRATQVFFDDVSRPFTILSDFEIRTTSAAAASGDHYFSVRSPPASQQYSAVVFRSLGPPVVSSACPGNGPKEGGYWITLTGRDLDTTTAVRFGNAWSSDVEQVIVYEFGEYARRDKIRVRVPAHKSGVVALFAYNQYGTGAGTGRFVYTPLPLSADPCTAIEDVVGTLEGAFPG